MTRLIPATSRAGSLTAYWMSEGAVDAAKEYGDPARMIESGVGPDIDTEIGK